MNLLSATSIVAGAPGLEAKTYAKVDRRLLPFLFLCYILAYLDRVNVGFAKLQMLQDLSLSDVAFGTGAGIFFAGYFLFEVPSNLLLKRFGARTWIARIMVSWGILSSAMMWVKSEWAFYAAAAGQRGVAASCCRDVGHRIARRGGICHRRFAQAEFFNRGSARNPTPHRGHFARPPRLFLGATDLVSFRTKEFNHRPRIVLRLIRLWDLVRRRRSAPQWDPILPGTPRRGSARHLSGHNRISLYLD